MRRRRAPLIRFGAAAVALAAALLASAPASAATELLVTVPVAPVAVEHRDFRRPPNYAGGARMSALLDELARRHGLRRVHGWPIRALDLHCEVFEVRGSPPLDALLADLRADPRVDAAQPMLRHATLAEPYTDPLVATQRTFSDWRLDLVHRVARGSGATIAVVDAGIEREHPDLAGHVAPRADFTGGSRTGAHGTAVAGLIVAQPNGVGVVGVAPEARVLDLKACWAEKSANALESVCSSLSLARALDAAITARAEVVNLSLSGPDDPLVGRLIARAVASGASVVAAAGAHDKTFPATRDDVIAVSGTTRADTVQAPDRALWTTLPGGQYDVVEGNSFAAAQVSGLVALLRARQPEWTPAHVRALLLAQPRLQPLALLDSDPALTAPPGAGPATTTLLRDARARRHRLP